MLKRETLRNKKEFSIIYNKGKSIGDRYVVIIYKKNNLGYNRIAVIASKKIGNAVVRNRARRLIKESLRKIGDFPFKGWDLIFIARKNIIEVKCYCVEKSITKAISKTAMLRGKNI